MGYRNSLIPRDFNLQLPNLLPRPLLPHIPEVMHKRPCLNRVQEHHHGRPLRRMQLELLHESAEDAARDRAGREFRQPVLDRVQAHRDDAAALVHVLGRDAEHGRCVAGGGAGGDVGVCCCSEEGTVVAFEEVGEVFGCVCSLA